MIANNSQLSIVHVRKVMVTPQSNVREIKLEKCASCIRYEKEFTIYAIIECQSRRGIDRG